LGFWGEKKGPERSEEEELGYFYEEWKIKNGGGVKIRDPA